MGRGGPRPGSGRKRGSSTKKTRRIADEAADRGQTPLEYLLALMVDTTATAARRDWAADRAAQYCHPRLAMVAVQSSPQPSVTNNFMQIRLVRPDDPELPGETIDDVPRIGPSQ